MGPSGLPPVPRTGCKRLHTLDALLRSKQAAQRSKAGVLTSTEALQQAPELAIEQWCSLTAGRGLPLQWKRI